MTSYNQESKNEVRELMLKSAIVALTSKRHSSELIDRKKLKITFDHFLSLIQHGFGAGSQFDELHSAAEVELSEWMEFDACCNTRRKSCELKVLYLCGPSPTNDLAVLLEHGINIHNIWAVTGSSEDSAAAHRELSKFNLALKVHEGSLAEFFGIYNEVFDLIYFDACGPFMGGKPSTLSPVVAILEKQRLSPKGALITNYSAPPDSGPARDRYVSLATAYFHPRYEDIPDVVRRSDLDPAIFAVDPEPLKEFITGHLEPVYSDLITQLTIDLAAAIIPSLRAFSMPAFLKKLAGQQEVVGELITRQTEENIRENGLPGDRWLSPSSYPILSFIDRLEEYNPNDPLLTALQPYNRQGNSFKHLISVSELTRSVIEGNWDVTSPELLAAIKCSWFDYKARITCDIPLPNLLVSSLVGTYGRPYFYNPRLSRRVKYISNVREMYCDLFAFDQCRSFFDWFPTVQACPSRFRSIPFQIVARCLIDRLSWAHFYNTAKPFHGAAIGGMGETSAAKPLFIPKRRTIKRKEPSP
jgi:hypothetical protein